MNIEKNIFHWNIIRKWNNQFHFSFPTGPLASLQTDERYFGKGYGGLVLRYLSKKIAEIGHDPCAGISENNIASLSLFRKNGYKLIGKHHSIKTTIMWSPADEWTSNEM